MLSLSVNVAVCCLLLRCWMDKLDVLMSVRMDG